MYCCWSNIVIWQWGSGEAGLWSRLEFVLLPCHYVVEQRRGGSVWSFVIRICRKLSDQIARLVSTARIYHISHPSGLSRPLQRNWARHQQERQHLRQHQRQPHKWWKPQASDASKAGFPMMTLLHSVANVEVGRQSDMRVMNLGLNSHLLPDLAPRAYRGFTLRKAYIKAESSSILGAAFTGV